MPGDPKRPPAPAPGEDEGEGSYTARPSREVPEEGGRTRHEEDEEVERTGTPGRDRSSEGA